MALSKSDSDTMLPKMVGPHHNGIISKRKMKNTHDCVQCHERGCDMYIVHIVVLWRRFQDLYIACCDKCLNRLEECSIGEVI